MDLSPEANQLNVTRRFLLRFADLMSNGSNSANLLLAAELLESYAKRAVSAETSLRDSQSRCSELESKMSALCDPDRVQLPRTLLQLAKTQFETLCSEFEKSGNVIGQAMCQASASTLARYVNGPAADSPETIKPNAANASTVIRVAR